MIQINIDNNPNEVNRQSDVIHLNCNLCQCEECSIPRNRNVRIIERDMVMDNLNNWD